MDRESANANGAPNRLLAHGYGAIMLLLTLTGFGQMPIFKRYYIADIPGLGWLAMFYVTHYLHYLGAILLLAVLAYIIVQYLMADRRRITITTTGYLRAGMLGGILVTGCLMVIRNLDGIWLAPGFIIFLDLAHLGLVMIFLATTAYCLAVNTRWTRPPSKDK